MSEGVSGAYDGLITSNLTFRLFYLKLPSFYPTIIQYKYVFMFITTMMEYLHGLLMFDVGQTIQTV